MTLTHKNFIANLLKAIPELSKVKLDPSLPMESVYLYFPPLVWFAISEYKTGRKELLKKIIVYIESINKESKIYTKVKELEKVSEEEKVSIGMASELFEIVELSEFKFQNKEVSSYFGEYFKKLKKTFYSN